VFISFSPLVFIGFVVLVRALFYLSVTFSPPLLSYEISSCYLQSDQYIIFLTM